jgi:hypothetical protein
MHGTLTNEMCAVWGCKLISWQQHFEGGPFSWSAFGPDVASVVLGYFSGNGQADTCTAVFVVAMQAGKNIKDAFGVFLRKSNSVILYFY